MSIYNFINNNILSNAVFKIPEKKNSKFFNYDSVKVYKREFFSLVENRRKSKYLLSLCLKDDEFTVSRGIERKEKNISNLLILISSVLFLYQFQN